MIIGNKSQFAIESVITHAYERLSFRALGYFVIHIGNKGYGVNSLDATMLACSFDEVTDRIKGRGTHTAFFAMESNANRIAAAVCASIYSEEQNKECFFGISRSIFDKIIYSNKLIWAPDGDEAFDDGSHVLQFDVENRVRLIGFKRDGSEADREYHSLTDTWLDADEFYGTLQGWHDAFESEWERAIRKTQ